MTRAELTTATSSATLVIETPGGAIEPRALARDELTIGRDARCDVMLDHPTVSRLHARLWRDASGWHFQDLGSQNGSRVSAQFLATPSALTDGIELHIGRVRAWFFGGNGVPDSWRPSAEDAEHAGRLVRCRCGHIGWAPDHAAGMRLPCAKCGRDLLIRDRPVAATPVPRAVVECAACHTSVLPTDKIQTCTDCGAQMHADCWRENHGCATYGCSQVGVAEQVALNASEAVSRTSIDGPEHAQFDDVGIELAPARSIPLYAAQTILIALIGLPTFGAPAIAYGAYRALVGFEDQPTRKRLGYATASFLAGVCGFVASCYWWLGGVG